MSNLFDINPIIDAGSDTASRYRYQAEITLQFCLYCALGTEIVSVIPEHLEDICIEGTSFCRFVQVKSRNEELGLWTLSDLLKSGGALHSLFRTYNQIKTTTSSLEIMLEGALKPRDLIEELQVNSNRNNPSLIEKTAKALEIDISVASAFLQRVSIIQSPPPRQYIRDLNISLLQHQKSDLQYAQVLRIYNDLIAEIERATRAEVIGISWPSYISNPSTRTPENIQRLNAKRLTKERLKEIVAPLCTPPRQLLKRLIDPSSYTISVLDRKLLAGGATEEINKLARNLHANSQEHFYMQQAMDMFKTEALLDDLNQRIEIYALSKVAEQAHSSRPAVSLWNALLTEFTANAANIDLNRIMNADPLLLLGQACDLSNRCVFNWGMSLEG